MKLRDFFAETNVYLCHGQPARRDYDMGRNSPMGLWIC